jgi:hypothetical protein
MTFDKHNGRCLISGLDPIRQEKANDPMKLLLLQAITAATGAAVVDTPKIPQMPDDAQDRDRCDRAAVVTAAGALGPSPRHDFYHDEP